MQVVRKIIYWIVWWADLITRESLLRPAMWLLDIINVFILAITK